MFFFNLCIIIKGKTDVLKDTPAIDEWYCYKEAWSSMTVSLFYHSSLSSIDPGRTSRWHLICVQSWYKSLLVGQHWSVYVHDFMRESRLWVRPCFSSCDQRILFVLLGWFMKWEVGGRRAAVLKGVVSRICSR